MNSNTKSANAGGDQSTGATDVLNEYTIEYAEDLFKRDTVLQSTRKVNLMKYIPENRKILIIQENSDSVIVMNEDFDILSKLESSKVVPTVAPTGTSKENLAAKASKVDKLNSIRRFYIYIIFFTLFIFFLKKESFFFKSLLS